MERLLINFALGIIGLWTVIAVGGMIAPTSLVGATNIVSAAFHTKAG